MSTTAKTVIRAYQTTSMASGSRVRPAKCFLSMIPSTEEVIAQRRVCTAADVDSAVKPPAPHSTPALAPDHRRRPRPPSLQTR